jgi:hypothetical protein
MKKLRRHLSYANVAATLALLFAMTGSAIAAKHYLINSTKQINPKVLKKLKGNRGPRGLTGIHGLTIQGPTGATGVKGTSGLKGNDGTKGADGFSALSTLPSGATESGIYSFSPGHATVSDEVRQAVTFPIKLAAPIPVDKVIYTKTGSALHCSGLGHADAGYLCIYSEGSFGLSTPPEVRNWEAAFGGGIGEGTGVFGFVLEWLVENAEAGEIGTYTVTAP